MIAKKLLLLLALTWNLSVNAQNILFADDFSAPKKWKTSSSSNGSMVYEKEGTETVMKVSAFEEKMFGASFKLPALQPNSTKVVFEYNFFLTEKFNAHVIFGEKPNRLNVNSDGDKGLRLCGESIKIAEGAKFMTLATNQWHKMKVAYDFSTKRAIYTLDDKETKEVDLNLQPDKEYRFQPTLIEVRAFNGGVIKIKSLIILEL